MEAVKRCAARHGPNVCELEGPIPILKISNTEMLSCGKVKIWAKIHNRYIAIRCIIPVLLQCVFLLMSCTFPFLAVPPNFFDGIKIKKKEV